jgi:hypothetical protein
MFGAAVGGAQDAPARCFCLRAAVRWSTHTKQCLEEEDGRWRGAVLGWHRGGRCHHRSQQPLSTAPPPGTPQHHDAIHVCSFNSEILKLVCSPVACVKLDSHASIGANYDKLKGKCAFGPFLSILVIECKHKCLNVKICPRMIKVQITS